jgi:hypothetical protein
MKLRIVWTVVFGLGLSGAVYAQASHAQTAAEIYLIKLEGKGILDAAPVQPRADGTKARELELTTADIVRRAGFDPRTHVLAVVGRADAMGLVIWDRRQPSNAPGTAAAQVGSLALSNKLRLSKAGKFPTIDLATASLTLSASAGGDSLVLGSTSIARLAGTSAGATALAPAVKDGTGSLGTIELCSAGACSKGYMTTVDLRINFRKSIGYTQTPVPDSDGDGYADDVDQCPSAGDQGYGLDSVGCPISGPQDSDGDGVMDSEDACPGQGDVGYGVSSNGCPNVDSDGDGVYDAIDFCPDRGEEGYGVDPDGCPNPPSPQDYDGDGVTDDIDQCFAEGDTYGYGVDSSGCPIRDSDGDGYADPYDSCPSEGDLGNGVDGSGCPVPVDNGIQRQCTSGASAPTTACRTGSPAVRGTTPSRAPRAQPR